MPALIELFWKTLERFLAEEGIATTTPRESLSRAYQAGWLSDETAWLKMLRDRNETPHICDEATALRIVNDIRDGFPEIERALAFLKGKFGAGG